MKNFKLIFSVLILTVLSASARGDKGPGDGDKIKWKLTVISASGLENTARVPADMSDPYAEFRFHRGKVLEGDGRTPAAENSLNPSWNYTAEGQYAYNRYNTASDEIILEVRDRGPLRDAFLGIASVKNPQPGIIYTLPLKSRKVQRGFSSPVRTPGIFARPGEVKVKFEYDGPSPAPSDPALQKVPGKLFSVARLFPEGHYFLKIDTGREEWDIYPRQGGEPAGREKYYYYIAGDEPGYVLLGVRRELPFKVFLRNFSEEEKERGEKYSLPAAVKISDKTLIGVELESGKKGEFFSPVRDLDIGFVRADEDKYEPNGSIAEAAVIKLNTELEALLLPRNDEDFYRFWAPPTGEVFIEAAGRMPLAGRIFSRDGGNIVRDDFNFPILFRGEPGEEYILKIKEPAGSQQLRVEGYNLYISDGTNEEKGDERFPAARYSKGEPASGECLDKAAEAYRLWKAGEPVKADRLYRRALDCISGDPALWNDYGTLRYELGNLNSAVSAFETALELDPEFAPAWRSMAVIAWYNENWQEGMQRASKAAGLNHSDKNLWYAARAYILAAARMTGQEKMRLLHQAQVYYRAMKDPSQDCLRDIEEIEKMMQRQ